MRTVQLADLVHHDAETIEVTALIISWGKRGLPRETAIALLAAGIGTGITTCGGTAAEKAKLLATTRGIINEILVRAAQAEMVFTAGTA